MDSSQEEADPDLRKEKEALKAAFVSLEKAKEDYRKAAANKAGKGEQPTQARLDSFFLSEPGSSSLDVPLPALKDCSPAKPGPQPDWLVAANEELSEEGVKEKALLQ